MRGAGHYSLFHVNRASESTIFSAIFIVAAGDLDLLIHWFGLNSVHRSLKAKTVPQTAKMSTTVVRPCPNLENS